MINLPRQAYPNGRRREVAPGVLASSTRPEGTRPHFAPDFCTENSQRFQRRKFGAPFLNYAIFV